jgi:K+-sensing histidine kinase KdpD
MTPRQITIFRGSAAQCFYGIIALTLLTFVCLRLKADLATTAFIYLAVIVLLSLIGSYVASMVLTIVAVSSLAFFAPPVSSFAIDLPQDIALVIVFLLASLTVTGLVRRARKLTQAARQAEVLARQAERELRFAIDTIPALVWTALPDGSLDFINQRWEEIGLSLDNVREWNKELHPVDL